MFRNGFHMALILWVCTAVSTFGAQPIVEAEIGILEEGKLYLRAETVETQAVENLLVSRPTLFDASKMYVVQLDGPMTPARRAELTATGIRLQSYLPHNAYLADLGQARPEQVSQLAFVQWVGEYRDSWKIEPTIGQPRLIPFQSPERIQIAANGELKLIVTLFEGRDLNQGMADLANLGAWVIDGNMIGDQGAVDIVIGKDELGLLAQQPYIQFIEEAPEFTLRNASTRWIVQSNTTNVSSIHNQGIRGLGQIVGIIDGKVNINHCSFLDSANPVGPLHRKIQAYNTTLGSESHGTHVAGTACGDAGVDNNTRGIAYEGRLCYNTIPSFNESAVVSRFNTHHGQGARIHTNSWGNDNTTAYDSMCRGIDVFSWNNEEDLVLFAVTNLGTLKNPENAKNLLAVGASQDSPNQGSHCSGGTGPTNDQRRKPEIYAPGCSTQSSQSSSSCGTVGMTGTSMASPAVAGVAMLVRQYYMDGFYPSGAANPSDSMTPSGALIKATLLNSAVDMTGIGGFPSNQEGWGRVLADNALAFVGDTRKLIVLDDIRNASGFSTGQFMTYNVTVVGSSQALKVTLVFTDVAAAAGANPASVNDLDLEVTSPSAVTFLGNVFSGGASAAGGTKDAKNNVEQVLFNAPETGIWTVRVNAAVVNQSTQGYALIVTGEVALDPTCTDGIQNQGEDLIDCGGPCPPCDCLVDADCDDGAFCTGAETCSPAGQCVLGESPCTLHEAPYCDENGDVCRQCLIDVHCNDGRFCSGVETCDKAFTCQSSGDPCTDPDFSICDELTDNCDQCQETADCDDADTCTSDACEPQSRLCEHTTLTIIYGDVDGSLLVDSDDLVCLLNGFQSFADCPPGDIDPCATDGDIDVDDIVSILLTFMGEPPCSDPCPAQP